MHQHEMLQNRLLRQWELQRNAMTSMAAMNRDEIPTTHLCSVQFDLYRSKPQSSQVRFHFQPVIGSVRFGFIKKNKKLIFVQFGSGLERVRLFNTIHAIIKFILFYFFFFLE